MTTVIGLADIPHNTQIIFSLGRRTFKIYSPTNFQIRSTVVLVTVTMLYLISPGVTFFLEVCTLWQLYPFCPFPALACLFLNLGSFQIPSKMLATKFRGLVISKSITPPTYLFRSYHDGMKNPLWSKVVKGNTFKPVGVSYAFRQRTSLKVSARVFIPPSYFHLQSHKFILTYI